MAYDANVLRRATARLEENKRRREDQREQLRQQLYAREPRLAKLDRQLQGTMAQLVAASLRKGEDAGAAGHPGQKSGHPAGACGPAGRYGPARGRPGPQARLSFVQ